MLSAKSRPVPARYLNRLISTKSGARLVAAGVFPNAKEVTESFAAREAIKHAPDFNPGDRSVVLVAVGDGTTPRTAATFAATTAWECHSVDPRLRATGQWSSMSRLTTHRARIEDTSFEAALVVVVLVHAHVRGDVALASVTADRLLVIALPCCVPVGLADTTAFRDADVGSPANEIQLWRATNHEATPVVARVAPVVAERTPPQFGSREELIAALTDADPDRRVCAAKYLDHHFDDGALPHLIENLVHPNARVRQWSLHALGCDQCKEGSCRPDQRLVAEVAVELLLTDGSRYVRQAAAALLGPLVAARPEVVAALEQARDHDPHANVREVARRFTPGHRPYARAMREAELLACRK